MRESTENILTTVLKADETVSDAQRRRAMQILKDENAEQPQQPPMVKLLKRRDVAAILGCSVQMVDYYSRKGWLEKRKLAKQSRASGIPDYAVREFINGGKAQGVEA